MLWNVICNQHLKNLIMYLPGFTKKYLSSITEINPSKSKPCENQFWWNLIEIFQSTFFCLLKQDMSMHLYHFIVSLWILRMYIKGCIPHCCSLVKRCRFLSFDLFAILPFSCWVLGDLKLQSALLLQQPTAPASFPTFPLISWLSNLMHPVFSE